MAALPLTTVLARWLPRRCAACGLARGAPLCAGCEADFFPADAPRCARCAVRVAAGADRCGACLAHPPAFDATAALADYAGPAAGMVVALKFRARIDLAALFGELLGRRASAAPDDLVLAVPLAFERERERGFNQAREIARYYAATCRATLGAGLQRVRHTSPQQSLAKEARRANVRGAFRVTTDVAGRRVLVVDDVMTTGATLDEVARVLKRAGAARVENRIVARTP